jgi:hypothetical protein
MQSEHQSGSTARTKLVHRPRVNVVSLWMMIAIVFVGVLVVLVAQGYTLPFHLTPSIRSVLRWNPWVLGVIGYVGLMFFLGCCLMLIPREDDDALETDA